MPLPHRTTRLIVAVLTAAVLALAAPLAATAAPTVRTSATSTASVVRALTPTSGVLFGAYVEHEPDQEAGTTAFEHKIGRKLDLERIYSPWDWATVPTAVTAAIARGRTPVWTVKTITSGGTKIGWASIASGAQDARIAQQAEATKALGVPVILTFQHEPDYSAGYGTPADYRAAYRHYVAVFDAHGVTNALWAWVLTPGSFGAHPSTAGADAYYPGDDVVDWVGLDPYNWDGCAAGVPPSWRSLAQAATAFRTWGDAHGKPLMLAEWGSVEDPDQPGRKAAWLRDAMDTIASWPELKAVLYFHAQGNCPWWVNSTGSALDAFRAIAASPTAHGRASAWLQPSTTTGAAPLAVTFDGSASTGTASVTGAGVTSWTLDLGDGTTRTGTGQPPAALAHRYAAGTYTAALTVVDATGSVNTDRRSISAAAVPTLTAAEADVTASSATLKAWVGTDGLPGSVRFDWTPQGGRTTSATTTLDAHGWVQAVVQPVDGLPSATPIDVRITATTAAGTTVLTRSFPTAGAPTFTWTTVSDRTASSARVAGGVVTNRLAGGAWVQYGTSPDALTSATAAQQLAGLTYEQKVGTTLTGLSAGRTYYWRLAARNASGLRYGPTQSFTTRG